MSTDIMVNEVQRKGLWIDQPSPAQAAYIVLKTRHCLKIPSKSEKNRIRRIDQLEWTTCARQVREVHTKKPRRGANSS